MDNGMLWFDNDKDTSIPNKVEKAAQYYREKYGVSPDLCYVHPKMVVGKKSAGEKSAEASNPDQLMIGKVLVLKNKKVLPDHFWIGVGTSEDPVS